MCWPPYRCLQGTCLLVIFLPYGILEYLKPISTCFVEVPGDNLTRRGTQCDIIYRKVFSGQDIIKLFLAFDDTVYYYAAVQV